MAHLKWLMAHLKWLIAHLKWFMAHLNWLLAHLNWVIAHYRPICRSPTRVSQKTDCRWTARNATCAFHRAGAC